jgi:aminoglycoside phosphotransferase (APT) family kinase protein
MRQLNDTEIGEALLSYLARSFECPDLAYAAKPARIAGGFDAAIFGFTLDRAPPPLAGPLILRLARAATDPQRVKLESVIQNTLADMGFPAPRVMVTESDRGILGGAFVVMRRLPGQPLAHGIEGFGAGESFVGRVRLIAALPTIFAQIIDAWVDLQIRLHELPAEPLMKAVSAAGLDADGLTFEGQMKQLRTIVARSRLAGLEAGLKWLEEHRPPMPTNASICHGDFHPLNILADGGRPTGVIDWVNTVIAAPEMDIGSAIANITAVPLNLSWALQAPARALIARALRRYQRAYAARRPINEEAVRYYAMFRAVAQLVWVGRARAAGQPGGGAFHSPAGTRNLVAFIKTTSGVSMRLETQ